MHAGIYLHVPFCSRHCPFCDFAITTDYRLKEAWKRSILEEIKIRAEAWSSFSYDTIYLGGGTPSTLPAPWIEELIEVLKNQFSIEAQPEITIEVNPADFDTNFFPDLASIGVNRISLGIQSFDSEDLELLGRDHSLAQVFSTYELAQQAGINNISIDLIHGLPARDLFHWEKQLERAAQLSPTHISSYALTYEPGTPFTKKRDKGELQEISEELQSEIFLFTHRYLNKVGIQGYEVSNFASSTETRSRHNQKYWYGAPYLGLGPGAHSFTQGMRSWNLRSTPAYIHSLENGILPQESNEELNLEQQSLELLFLSLRTYRGLDLNQFQIISGRDLLVEKRIMIDELLEKRWAEIRENHLLLTLEGLAVADSIAVNLSEIEPN